MVVVFSQVYNIKSNAESLKLLFLDPERKIQCYNMHFINGCLHNEDYKECRNICNSVNGIKGSTFNKFEVNYYDKLKEVI
jgi:hypothetical protein